MPQKSPQNHSKLTIYALSKLGQTTARIAEAALAPLGLRPREFSTLALIDELGGAAQSDVADGLGLDRSDMVTIVDKLEGLGLVARAPDARDRRRHVVSTTPKGAALVIKGAAALTAADAEFLKRIPKSDRRKLSELLDALAAD